MTFDNRERKLQATPTPDVPGGPSPDGVAVKVPFLATALSADLR
ncbi:MAG TPA: hypothetical protein VGG16_26075 [Streptosporangiaceae bacterium]